MKKNSINSDGSVNSFQETGKLGHGYYVSFLSADFDKQIEPNIFLPVLLLNAKGITTYSSCQGHSHFDKVFNRALRTNSGPQITVRVSLDQAPILSEYFNSTFITTELNTTIDNDSLDYVYISIRIRWPYNRLFTNKFLCRQILAHCEALPYK